MRLLSEQKHVPISSTISELGGDVKPLLQIREWIKHVAALLEKTDASIQEIARQTGAGNLSAFYKDFQQQYGMLPAAWRRQHGAGG